jgi:hypothetical protein
MKAPTAIISSPKDRVPPKKPGAATRIGAMSENQP